MKITQIPALDEPDLFAIHTLRRRYPKINIGILRGRSRRIYFHNVKS